MDHDALPSSHSDAAYEELMNVAREIRSAAARLEKKAAGDLLKQQGIRFAPRTTGTATGQAETSAASPTRVPDTAANPFVVFNTLGFDAKNTPLQGVIYCEKYADDLPPGVIVAADGTRLPIEKVSRTEGYSGTAFLLDFHGDIPALGYAVFRYEQEERPAPCELPISGGIENEYYHIKLNRYGVEEIFDKRLGHTVAVDGVCVPYIEEDAGHLWGRTHEYRSYAERIDKPFCVDVMSPSLKHSIDVSAEAFDGGQRAIVKITYDRPEQKLTDFIWTMTATLRTGSDAVEFRIDTRWQAADLRLLARFQLPYSTDKMIREIPFGQLERGYVNEYYPAGGYVDDHAALRYICAYDENSDWTLTLTNTGTPAHRLLNGTILVSLMRSPTQLWCGYGIEGAREEGARTFEFTLSSNAGKPVNPAPRGWVQNARFPSYGVDCAAAVSISMLNLPDNAMLSALKWAEDGTGLVARYYESYGCAVELDFGHEATEIDILEHGAAGSPACVHGLRPFEIKTFAVGQGVSIISERF